MAEPRSACPLCGAPSAHAFTVTDRNRAISDERFEYRRCSACHSYFIWRIADAPAAPAPRDWHRGQAPRALGP